MIGLIGRNEFLARLYPFGLGDVRLGRLELGPSDRCSLDLHVFARPSIETEKWGVWGSDYDVVVVHLMSTHLESAKVKGWSEMEQGLLRISPAGSLFKVSFGTSVELVSGQPIFQRATTYLGG